MDYRILFETFSYISKAPFFWQFMGLSTSIFMFIGGIVHDGRVEEAKKGIITIGAYSLMLLWITILRVNDRIATSNIYADLSRTNASMAFAGIVTTLSVSVACILGIVLGVSMVRYWKSINNFIENIKSLLK